MIQILRLLDFRCFSSLSLDLSPSGAIFIGNNAQGKTSLLEAICTLIRLQSPRTNRLNTLTKFSAQGFGIAGNPWGQERKIVQTPKGLMMKSDGELRHSRTDYLADGGLIVWMGNEDLNLVRGSGETRRTYLDFLGAQLDPTYRTAYTRYRRALKAKNLLLKEPKLRLPELIAYEDILIEHGEYLTRARQQLITELSPLASAAQADISNKSEELSLRYLPASGPSMKESILQARQRETATRQAVVGPHRDDFSIRLHGRPAADYASEGQQRTIALALKLAQGDLLRQRCDKTPIYLLDDIFGELDPPRRNALLRHLPSNAQTFITTTHLDWMESSPLVSLPIFDVTGQMVKPRTTG
ncbi:MAG: replication and repair protein RecF [Verrucomicrobiota bacterium]